MLKELYIENLAVIEKADISFTDNFNVFSGETGAGKSILIGAINAVLGERTYKDVVRSGEEKASVTAIFDAIPKRTAEKLAEYGYDTDSEIMIKREISADGKGSVRICGKPATVAVLKDISSGLIDIHGQHDNRILTDNVNQRELIDGNIDIKEKLQSYGELFREFSRISKQIKQLEADNAEKDERIEKLTNDIREVEKLCLKHGDEALISEKLNRVRNLEEITSSLKGASENINGCDNEQGASDMISAAATLLAGIDIYIGGCKELSERLSALLIELSDISAEISGYIPDSDDIEELPDLEERMSGILHLKRKFGLETDEIIDLCEEWKKERAALSECDNTIAALNEERHRLGDEVKKAALEISDMRKREAEALTERILQELRFLDMPDVRLRFEITQGKITVHGMDNVELLISVNKGEDLKPIAKVASGGELSRIMLAIKSVCAENDDTPTMIFDEIDTGISGRAAQKVGRKLYELSQKRQVLCVTHLAQIAALSDNHLLINKSSDDSRTYTTVQRLDYDEKVKEIARIISGDSSEASLKNAAELIKNGKTLKAGD